VAGKIQLVFLDRDGVINRRPAGRRFVTCWREFEFLPGVAEAIHLLNQHSVWVIVATNQRGISMGLYSESDLQDIHSRMQQALGTKGARLDGIYYCPHAPGECECRKPYTGLFEQALRHLPPIDRADILVIGDSDTDMVAAHRFGCRRILVGLDRDSASITLANKGISVGFSCESLLEAVKGYILR